MKKFIVTVTKMESYSTDIEIEAGDEDEAVAIALSEAQESNGIEWRYWESEFDTINVGEA